MTPEALLRLLRQHWDETEAALDPPGRELLRARLRALAEATGDDRATARALHGVKLALLPLPFDHPVRQALDGQRGAVLDHRPAADAARELLAWLEPATDTQPEAGPQGAHGAAQADAEDSTAALIADAQRRLLAAPRLSGAELATLSVPATGLIRLVDAGGHEGFPAFQFATDGSPLPVVTRINALLLAEQDPWGAADWWLAGNSWLGGTPAELLGRISDELLAAAALALTEGD
ncbi:hypothetical protein CFP65_1398 [Kitasatospora sp. MMS16-BH015]|uniref:hypothetical protein n=1 Tax=Kitasatospora sp. MMS16-BH015 TaxID=2018025 RepID=UPI000CA28B0B|nr:hypothetical protein [Kitasatospora sp. MMS16-BH015]AUG76297.1 hypothetical protein CFP65_1398 [Kitasatospora sp. MMS16-BH015]